MDLHVLSHGNEEEYLTFLWTIFHSILPCAVAILIVCGDNLHCSQWKFQLSPSQLTSAAMATDAFFVVAGFTVTLDFIKRCKFQQGPPKIYFFWLRKVVSVLPAYALVVLFHATAVRLIGDGPMWDRIVGSEARRCQNFWWTNLLFINNFFKVGTQVRN